MLGIYDSEPGHELEKCTYGGHYYKHMCNPPSGLYCTEHRPSAICSVDNRPSIISEQKQTQ